MSELAGMTVNERLLHKGLMDEYDHAVLKVNIPVLRRILKSIELDEEDILAVIRSKFPFLSDAVLQGER